MCPLALDNALPMSYRASESVQPIGFCRIFVKISIFKILPERTWGKFQKKFHVWGPLAPKPLNLVNPKSVPDNHIHSWACLQKFVLIAQYLRGVMSWKTHSPQLGRRNRKKSQNSRLESHVWSQISQKPVKIEIWIFLRPLESFHILTFWKMGVVA